MIAETQTRQITWDRWLKAQEYEQGFWRKSAAAIEKGTVGELDWYGWRARQLEDRLASLPSPVAKTGKVLEIGSGPIGIVNFLEWGERYAVDPLEHFYRQTPSLTRLRRPGATYLKGTGEQLPMPDASCSLVIIENVIDHTFAPGKILKEISRVLAPGGWLYLLVNVHTRWGAMLHDALAVLQIDKGHPYTFTSRTLRRFMTEHGFSIEREEIESYAEASQKDRDSSGLTDRIKGYTGLSEFRHSVFCRRAAERLAA